MVCFQTEVYRCLTSRTCLNARHSGSFREQNSLGRKSCNWQKYYVKLLLLWDQSRKDRNCNQGEKQAIDLTIDHLQKSDILNILRAVKVISLVLQHDMAIPRNRQLATNRHRMMAEAPKNLTIFFIITSNQLLSSITCRVFFA